MENNIDLLQQTVAETAGATLSISPTESGWQCYMVQQKKKFENTSFDTLCKDIVEFIKVSRQEKEVKGESNKKGANKPFRMK